MNKKAIAALFLVHFTGDMFQSFFHPLFPVLKENLQLSLTQIGIITGVITVASFVTQPITGFLADKSNPRLFILTGLLLSIACIPMVAVAPDYWWVLLAAGAGAFGSSLYHPAAAGMVSKFAFARTGLAMSFFGLGGTLAFTLGPVLLTTFVAFAGFAKLPLAIIPGSILLLLVLALLPRTHAKQKKQAGTAETKLWGLQGVWGAVILLWLISTLRTLVDVSLKTFYPILYMDQGHSLVSMGAVLGVYMLGGSVSALAAGQYADAKGYKGVFFWSFGLSAPALLLFLNASGWMLYPLAFISGFLLLATIFPALALATKIAPDNSTLASSLVFGFASGTGGLAAPLMGRLAEIWGLQNVLTALAAAPLICLLLAPFVFRRKGAAV